MAAHGNDSHGIFNWFVHSQVAGSVVLITCAAAAMVLANSPWSEQYFDILHTHIVLSWGEAELDLTLHHWINDGLMVLFFFVVGLEVKREILVGELSSIRQAALPVAGAVGGMVIPAAIYAMVNWNGAGINGWGIPMATDIAFALGILALFGKRVPLGVKVFLTALAIADDIGAILVIALFYTGIKSLLACFFAMGFLAALGIAVWVFRIRRLSIILILIFACWVSVFLSGIHATVAGILIAMIVPVRARLDPQKFLAIIEEKLTFLKSRTLTKESAVFDHEQLDALDAMHVAADDMRPSAIALEHYFHPTQALFVLPLFALANAGVKLEGNVFEVLLSPVCLGIMGGLVVGKQVGIFGCAWVIIKSGWASLPPGATWSHIYGASCLAGIGFTMSLFIAGLAFRDAGGMGDELLAEAKLGVLVASLISGIIGYVVLHGTLPKPNAV